MRYAKSVQNGENYQKSGKPIAIVPIQYKLLLFSANFILYLLHFYQFSSFRPRLACWYRHQPYYVVRPELMWIFLINISNYIYILYFYLFFPMYLGLARLPTDPCRIWGRGLLPIFGEGQDDLAKYGQAWAAQPWPALDECIMALAKSRWGQARVSADPRKP